MNEGHQANSVGRYRVGSERTVYPHVYLFNTAYFALERGIANEAGSTYEFITANVFTALSLESYLNLVGAERFPWWSVVERKLSPRDKLELVAGNLCIALDLGRRPYQSFVDAFKFRDLMAHAKSSRHALEEERRDGEVRYDQPQWEQSCNAAAKLEVL